MGFKFVETERRSATITNACEIFINIQWPWTEYVQLWSRIASIHHDTYRKGNAHTHALIKYEHFIWCRYNDEVHAVTNRFSYLTIRKGHQKGIPLYCVYDQYTNCSGAFKLYLFCNYGFYYYCAYIYLYTIRT